MKIVLLLCLAVGLASAAPATLSSLGNSREYDSELYSAYLEFFRFIPWPKVIEILLEQWSADELQFSYRLLSSYQLHIVLLNLHESDLYPDVVMALDGEDPVEVVIKALGNPTDLECKFLNLLKSPFCLISFRLP